MQEVSSELIHVAGFRQFKIQSSISDIHHSLFFVRSSAPRRSTAAPLHAGISIYGIRYLICEVGCPPSTMHHLPSTIHKSLSIFHVYLFTSHFSPFKQPFTFINFFYQSSCSFIVKSRILGAK